MVRNLRKLGERAGWSLEFAGALVWGVASLASVRCLPPSGTPPYESGSTYRGWGNPIGPLGSFTLRRVLTKMVNPKKCPLNNLIRGRCHWLSFAKAGAVAKFGDTHPNFQRISAERISLVGKACNHQVYCCSVRGQQGRGRSGRSFELGPFL